MRSLPTWLMLLLSSAPVRSVRRSAVCSVTSHAGQCGDAGPLCVSARYLLLWIDYMCVCALRHMMLCCLFESRTFTTVCGLDDELSLDGPLIKSMKKKSMKRGEYF